MPDMLCTNHPQADGSIVRCARCLRPFCSDCLVRIGGRPFCGDCKQEQLLDVSSGLPMQQAVNLASLWARFAAIFIDGIVIGIPIWILIIVFMYPTLLSGKGAGALPPGFNFIGFIAIPIKIVYEGLMLAARGQTLGKMALNIKVVRVDGSPITPGQAWGRASVRAFLLSCLALVNYLPAFFTNEKTCVHDMAAGTRVISLF